jgi:hypothetical protein
LFNVLIKRIIWPSGIFIFSPKWDEERGIGGKVELTTSETQKGNGKGKIRLCAFLAAFLAFLKN